MAVQLSVSLRNARADQVEVIAGVSVKLQLRSGAQPVSCASADSGTLLCEMSLPSDWLTDAANGIKSKNGVWSGTGAAGGDALHFRIKDSTGTTCHLQGSVSLSGNGGDMIISNTNITVGQDVSVNSFQITEPQA
jgi:hypothetical protein